MKPLGFPLKHSSIAALHYHISISNICKQLKWAGCLTTYMKVEMSREEDFKCLCTFKRTVHHICIYIPQHCMCYNIHNVFTFLPSKELRTRAKRWHVHILLHQTPACTFQKLTHSCPCSSHSWVSSTLQELQCVHFPAVLPVQRHISVLIC
jgi:hypothetical protein